MNRVKQFNFLSLLLVLLIVGCTPLIGSHSPTAYENATSLKAEVLGLMDKAQEPYDEHKDEVESVFLKANQSYEFVKGIPSNKISEKQWEILKDKNGALMGAFFSRWKKSKLSAPFIEQFKGQISDAFDEIICLEANKKDATDCTIED